MSRICYMILYIVVIVFLASGKRILCIYTMQTRDNVYYINLVNPKNNVNNIIITGHTYYVLFIVKQYYTHAIRLRTLMILVYELCNAMFYTRLVFVGVLLSQQKPTTSLGINYINKLI